MTDKINYRVNADYVFDNSNKCCEISSPFNTLEEAERAYNDLLPCTCVNAPDVLAKIELVKYDFTTYKTTGCITTLLQARPFTKTDEG